MKLGFLSNINKEYDELSPADIKHNMIFMIMLDSIFLAGAADTAIALQPLLVYLKASNTLIGLVLGAVWLGMFGQFMSPWITRRYRIKKWLVFWTNIPYLLPILLLSLGLIFATTLSFSQQGLLNFVVVCIVAWWFFSGFVGIPHQEYVAACIPMEYRGRFTGYSIGIGGGLGLATSAIGFQILEHIPRPYCFGYLFLMSWVLCQGGYLFSMLGREKPTPVEKSPVAWSRHMLRAFFMDIPFMKLVFLCSVSAMFIWPAVSFVSVFGLKGLNMPSQTAAVMQMINQTVRISTSWLSGIITDKLSAKRTLPFAFALGCFAFLPVVIFRSPMSVYFAMGLTAIVYVAFNAPYNALLYGLPSPENRAGHFALYLFINGAVAAIGTFIIGFSADKFGYIAVFYAVMAVCFLLFVVGHHMLKGLGKSAKDYS